MDDLLQDLRYCARQLSKTPSFALTALLSLALGIGATTSMFSVIYAILMDPYPYANPDQMAHMRLLDAAGHQRGFGLTGGQFLEIRKSPVLKDAFATDSWNLTITGSDLPEDVSADYVSANTFQFLGVPPILGRAIQPSDAPDGQDPAPVAVLSYKLWRRHFSGDPNIVGKRIQLVRKPYTVVGVAAQRFVWDDADIYLPLKITPDLTRTYYVGLRLRPGVAHATAAAALQPLLEQFAKDTPKHFPAGRFKLKMVGLNEDFEKRLGGTLSMLFAAVAFLLLIGCANVSILQLARGMTRQHEFAVRAAIGAARRRLIRQLLVESSMLSLTGAALGVALAYEAVARIADLLPQNAFPHEAAIRLNFPVLCFSVALALLTGIVSGLWPAFQLSRPDIGQLIQSGSRRVMGGSASLRANTFLIAAQIALTLVMLTGAGVAMRGFLQLLHTNLGYQPHNVMSVGIPIHDGTYSNWAARATYFEQIRDKVSHVPGVTIAAISSNATPPANGWNTNVEILGQAAKDDQKVRVNFVSPEYFPVLQVGLNQGRIWDQIENHNAAHLAVINETMVRKYFPNGALGHSLRIPEMKNEPPFTLCPADDRPLWLMIVGVIADKRDDGLRNPVVPEAFIPYNLGMGMYTQVLVRADNSPLTLLQAIGKEINSLDSDQQINAGAQDLEHWIQDQSEWQQGRLVTWLFSVFALLGLTLAATGLYSVVSFSVARRTNEFGIRMALGARAGDVLRLVFRSTVVSVGSGMACGVLLTLGLNQITSQMMSDWSSSSSRDIYVLFSAVVLLALVAIIAAAAPAGRASRVDPMTALRHE
jgi:predicted permease